MIERFQALIRSGGFVDDTLIGRNLAGLFSASLVKLANALKANPRPKPSLVNRLLGRDLSFQEKEDKRHREIGKLAAEAARYADETEVFCRRLKQRINEIEALTADFKRHAGAIGRRERELAVLESEAASARIALQTCHGLLLRYEEMKLFLREKHGKHTI